MKKKKLSKPKVRHVWAINPKTRVKKSAKSYERAKEKQRSKTLKWDLDLSDEM